MKFYYIVIGLFFFIACKEKKSEVKSEPAVVVNESTLNLPSIPNELVTKLYNETDYIDYIFHNLPISVSMDTKQDIQANIAMISTTPVGAIPSNCKAIGRKFFNSKGNTILGADIYFSNECAFYIFLDGEKKLYANKMTAEGLNFYNKIIQQAAKGPAQR